MARVNMSARRKLGSPWTKEEPRHPVPPWHPTRVEGVALALYVVLAVGCLLAVVLLIVFR